MLVDPVVNTEVGTWQRSFIIKTLLAQGNSSDQRSYGFFPYTIDQHFPVMKLTKTLNCMYVV